MSAQTRQRIIDAFADLCMIGEVPSMKDLAESVPVSRSTLYRHFPDRSALIDAMRSQAWAMAAPLVEAELGQLIGEGHRPTVFGSIRATVQSAAARSSAHRRALTGRPDLGGPVEELSRSLAAQLIVTAQRRGEVDPGLDPDLVAAVLVASVVSLVVLVENTDVLAQELLDWIDRLGRTLAPARL